MSLGENLIMAPTIEVFRPASVNKDLNNFEHNHRILSNCKEFGDIEEPKAEDKKKDLIFEA